MITAKINPDTFQVETPRTEFELHQRRWWADLAERHGIGVLIPSAPHPHLMTDQEKRDIILARMLDKVLRHQAPRNPITGL